MLDGRRDSGAKEDNLTKIERMRLITSIASQLQSDYSTSGINIFLAAFDIQNTGETIVPSKRVYVEQKLSFVSDKVITDIAKELKLIKSVSDPEISKHEILQIKEKIINGLTFVDIPIIDLILDEYKAPIHSYDDFDSKREYIKFKISEFSASILLEILDYLTKRKHSQKLPSFWDNDNLKVFISHLSKDKVKASRLSNELNKYNISSFVAHEDIEPNEEWLKCIEDALMTMDVLVALVTEEFDKSKWTAQEIGFALGRNIPVISIKNGMDPFGFFGQKQAIPGTGRTPAEITKDIISIIGKIPEYSESIKRNI
jgi:hypothetical protein